MKNSLFKESTEEMVERLCEKWFKEKTFPINLPLTDPGLKNCIIHSLKITDETYQRIITKGNYDFSNNSDLRSYVELQRENAVILQVAKIFAELWISNLPPPPLNHPLLQKRPYLQLVVNNG